MRYEVYVVIRGRSLQSRETRTANSRAIQRSAYLTRSFSALAELLATSFVTVAAPVLLLLLLLMMMMMMMVLYMYYMLCVMFFSSIVYSHISCNAKNGTFVTLQLLQSQEVDVLFGSICSTGKVPVL